MIWYIPLTEEIILKISGSADWTFFPSTLLSNGDSVCSRETCLKFLGLPRKRVWYVQGLLWKLIGNFGSRNYFRSDFLHLWNTILTVLNDTNQKNSSSRSSSSMISRSKRYVKINSFSKRIFAIIQLCSHVYVHTYTYIYVCVFR